MELVSIIIPIYNGEKYVEACVERIMAQTYENIECIMINDGSTDGTAQLLANISSDKIKVIEQKNSGVSSARNAGLDAAKGEYVAFVDVDDVIEEDFVESLVKGIKKSKLNIVCCGYRVIDMEDETLSEFAGNDVVRHGKLSRNDALKESLKPDSIKCTIWNKLFVRELIGELRFDERYTIGEDMLFLFEYMKNAGEMFFICERLYGYRVNPAGAMKTIENSTEFKDKWLTEWDAVLKLEELVKEWPEYDKSTADMIYYKKLIIAHKLYYKMKDCNVTGEKYIAYKKQMKHIVFGTPIMKLRNDNINRNWKIKLLLHMR